ncbi:tyrosine-type recombinase/integrase [Thermus oshimai]|jgi:integrase|uniref:tyrosine-type recombinase/integrase n=1 Tax=Thermus oshimai TaxID=56957 RepID=UPI0031FB40B3
MPKRRGNGEGTIFYHKPSGRYAAQVTVGRGEDGRPKRITVYGKTRAEVAAKLAELSAQAFKGTLPKPEAITFREWAERWLARKEKEVRPKTALVYRQDLAHMTTVLGDLRLQALRPHHIREALDRLAEKGLSPRTIRKALTLTRAVLEEGVKLELLPRNPADAVEYRAPTSPKAAAALGPEEVARLLEAAQGERLFPAFYLMLAVGLRRGEVLGLKWEDLDLEAGLLRVRRARVGVGGKVVESYPKTRNALRAVALPPDVVAVLQDLRARQEEEARMAGEDWQGSGYLFTDPLGRPVHPDTLNKVLRRVLKRAGLPEVRVHDLRHTYATLALRRGVPVEVVSERLGHSTPAFTLATYRHVLDEERRAYALPLAELLSGRPRAQA